MSGLVLWVVMLIVAAPREFRSNTICWTFVVPSRPTSAHKIILTAYLQNKTLARICSVHTKILNLKARLVLLATRDVHGCDLRRQESEGLDRQVTFLIPTYIKSIMNSRKEVRFVAAVCLDRVCGDSSCVQVVKSCSCVGPRIGNGRDQVSGYRNHRYV